MHLRTRLLLAFVAIILLTIVLSSAAATYFTRRELRQFTTEIAQEDAFLLAETISYEYFYFRNWETVPQIMSNLGYLPSAAVYAEILEGEIYEEGIIIQEAEFAEDFALAINELSAFEYAPNRAIVYDLDDNIIFDSFASLETDDLYDNPETAIAPIIDYRTSTQIGEVIVYADQAFFAEETLSFLTDTLRSTAIGGALSALLALLLGAWLANRISRPITALTQAATDLAQGKTTGSLPVHSNDELGQMSTAFNQLTDSLHTQRTLRQRLLNDVSHELNTPLSVIQLEATGLADGLQSPQEAAQQINQEVTHLRTLVQDLNWLAETDSGEITLSLEPTAIDALLTQEVGRWQSQAKNQSVSLKLDEMSALPPVSLDPTRFGQIIGNLLRNALQHTPPSGTITVSAKRGTVPTRDGEYAILTIADTGTGIAPEHLPHIFERFYRADESRTRSEGGRAQGRGLGLAITRQLVTLHDGHIWADSAEGAGSQFHIAFPI